jgi:hypothetical protein
MKAYKVKINIQRVVTVYEDEFKEEDPLNRDFNKQSAIDFAKSHIIDRLCNDPNYTNPQIIEEFEYDY